MSILSSISHWKDFERLAADLLEAEGFVVESEPSVDRSGADIVVLEEYRSHDPSRSIKIRWRVQCKHYAISNRNLGRKEVEEAIYSFESTREEDEGLFLMISSEYTEAAKEVIGRYLESHSRARVTLWNGRQIITRLERHPHIGRRYGIVFPATHYADIMANISRCEPCRILFISDQSPLAHNLSRVFHSTGFDVVFVPFWNYLDPVRIDLFCASFAAIHFKLVVLFLGDSFGVPLPKNLTKMILRSVREGASLLFFPFLAWSIAQGHYSDLSFLCPVRLLDTPPKLTEVHMEAALLEELESRIRGEYRLGDFRWLLYFDSFAENQYVEFDPKATDSPFIAGVESKFGLSHTFEFLRLTENAELHWADTAGNPFLVTMETVKNRICYLNTCCHSCVSPVVVSSPVEVALGFSHVLNNCLMWLLKK